jgi:signal transduction histidine kinase
VTTAGLDNLPSVAVDVDLMQKLFYHLIGNAVKYTPNGKAIVVSGYAGEGAVEIVVSDTGIGIAPEYHELIFEKFFQTGQVAFHSSGKTKFKGGGPGLGLAIAKGIVEAHGGRIWVTSPGYDETLCPGSQFHVMLPIA